jgi:hypothetical protein
VRGTASERSPKHGWQSSRSRVPLRSSLGGETYGGNSGAVRGAGCEQKHNNGMRANPGVGEVRREVRSLGTGTQDLVNIADWLKAQNCTHAAVEATGVYWKPVGHMLEGHVDCGGE